MMRSASFAAPVRQDGARRLKFLSVGRTHVGSVRTLNEDNFLLHPEARLWAVADGMGGHSRGDVASAAIVDALKTVRPCASAYGLRHQVSKAANRINEELFAGGRDEIVGTTLVTLIIHEQHYACLWAGDSRAYLWRGGRLKRLTSDHSEVQRLVDEGVIAAEDAPRHPRANIITRAIGARADVRLEDACGAVEPGDRFLLCSDGLHGIVTDRTIGDIMLRAPLEWAANALLDAALAKGGRDNITAVLIAAERSA